MDNFEIAPGDYIFELTEKTWIGFLVSYYAPFTGRAECIVTAGFRFSIRKRMRDDAFYIEPFESEKSKESVLFANADMEAELKYPQLYDKIQGFAFYITEQQLKSENVRFIKGDKEQLLRSLLSLHNKNT